MQPSRTLGREEGGRGSTASRNRNQTPCDEHARELVAIASQVRCKINLIPFNPFPQSTLLRSPAPRVRRFAQCLMDAGVVTTTRKTRGDDIDAACGQLAGEIRDRTRIAERMAAAGKAIPIRQVHA